MKNRWSTKNFATFRKVGSHDDNRNSNNDNIIDTCFCNNSVPLLLSNALNAQAEAANQGLAGTTFSSASIQLKVNLHM
jgi:hypothetical protein